MKSVKSESHTDLTDDTEIVRVLKKLGFANPEKALVEIRLLIGFSNREGAVVVSTRNLMRVMLAM